MRTRKSPVKGSSIYPMILQWKINNDYGYLKVRSGQNGEKCQTQYALTTHLSSHFHLKPRNE